MRERLTHQRCISFTEKTAQKIEEIATRLGVNFGDIVRECVENDLPKLIARERGRRKYVENK